MNESAQKYFTGKHCLVLGLAKSGRSVSRLLNRLGANVTINEFKSREHLQGLEELEEEGIRIVAGSHPVSLLDEGLDLIVKNPGIPYDIPFLQAAETRKIPVVTEVEIGYMLTDAPIIGITGTNGKTTTTTLIYEMLQGKEREPLIAGNIGTVFCDVAVQAKKDQWLVAELSSFQLLGTNRFKPEIALLLNIYDAHLDYHHTKEHYVGAKARLFQNQTAAQISVLNADQDVVAGLAQHLPSQTVFFSTQKAVERGAFLRNGHVYYKAADGEEIAVIHTADIRLPGAHNLENVLAAVTVSMEAGGRIDQIRRVLSTFEGVAHRLQFVRQLHDVRYYNDSKATNSLATQKAIQAFEAPVILIAGGLDRGDDFTSMIPLFSKSLKGLVAYGENASKLMAAAEQARLKHVQHVDNVEQAVRSAQALSSAGDVVLLSPASASWDQFRSFEERGDMFIQSVHMLK